MDHCAGAWQLKSKLTFLLSESWVSWYRQRLTGSSRFQIPVCATVMQSLQLQSGNFRFSWQEKQKIKTLRVFILAEAGIQPGLVRHQSISGHILVAHTHTGVHVFGLWEESGEHTNSTWPYHMTMRGGGDVTFEVWFPKWSQFIFEAMLKRKKNPFLSSCSHRQTINMTADLWPLIKLQSFMPKLFICFYLQTWGDEMGGREK